MTIEKLATLKDVLPENAEFISADHGGVFTDGVITWEMILQAKEEVTVTVHIKATDAAKGTILSNTAELTFDDIMTPSNTVVNPILSDPVKQVLNADGESINGHPVSEGDELTYKILFFNPSEDQKTFRITDKVPEHTEFVSIDNGGQNAGGALSWEVTLQGQESGSVSFKVKATGKNTVFRNQAAVTVDGKELLTNEVVNGVPEDPVKAVTDLRGNDINEYAVLTDQVLTYNITVNNPFDYEKTFMIPVDLRSSLRITTVSFPAITSRGRQ